MTSNTITHAALNTIDSVVEEHVKVKKQNLESLKDKYFLQDTSLGTFKNGNQKDTHPNEMGPCAQNIDTISCSIVNTMGRVYSSDLKVFFSASSLSFHKDHH